MKSLKKEIELAFKKRAAITQINVDTATRNAVNEVINLLDIGTLRVAEKLNGQWITHKWLKKAILLAFRINSNRLIEGHGTRFFDKMSAKFFSWNMETFEQKKIRVVPPANVRRGAYIAKNTVLMPSYVNIGAYVDEGTMIDTWATVGSCSQIGKNVHLSGGVGIGGVLEPVQDNPTIIEDNCFIGARSEIVEGTIVERNSVISMGVFIGKSTKIFNRQTKKIHYGRVPSGSVVVPGSLLSKDRSCYLYAAIIVKQVDQKTRDKLNINELLRSID